MGESVENLLRPSQRRRQVWVRVSGPSEETGVGESVENLLRPSQRRRQVWVRVSRTYCVHHRGGDRCG